MMTTKWPKVLTDDAYKRILLLACTCWGATAVLVCLRAFNVIPQSLGLSALLAMGGGVASSLALSRMRLADTISQVFHVGLQSAISLSANVFTDTCIMALDGKGRIESVDHADAIGWEEDEIVGRELRALLAPRSHGVRVLRAGTSMASPMLNQEGESFDARLSFAALKAGTGDEMHELAESMIVTVSPAISINTGGNYRA